MEFTQVVKNRYSCKKFSDRAVEPAKLEEILTVVSQELMPEIPLPRQTTAAE